MRRGGGLARLQGVVQAAPADDFADAVLAGLSKPQKAISSQFLYDARGSALFEEITALPEYYPTRTETAILSRYAGEMVDGLGADSVLVEFGSGSSVKTELLLSQLQPGVVYVPVDVSESGRSHRPANRRLLSWIHHRKLRPHGGRSVASFVWAWAPRCQPVHHRRGPQEGTA